MYYLAYGMNTNLDEMRRRCPLAHSLGTVTLTGHKLAFKGCCDVVEDQTTSMECALWEITDRCESALDILEGYPTYYDKKFVKVAYKGQTINAMIYFMQSGHELAMPGKGYLTTVMEGYQSHDIDIKQIKNALKEAEHAYYTW